MLRRVNVAIGGDHFPWVIYDRVVKNHVTPELAQHRRGGPIALPPDAFEWASDWSRHTAKVIADRGYDVVGDLDELTPGPARGRRRPGRRTRRGPGRGGDRRHGDPDRLHRARW